MSSRELTALPEVRINLRLWQRVLVSLFGLFWLGGVGYGCYLALRDSNAPIPLFFMFVFGVFVFYTALRPRLVARDDQVVVRNAFKTVTVRRSQIAEFRIGRGSGGAGSRTILIVPHEGEVISVDVSRQLGSREGDRLSRDLAALNAWQMS